MLSAWQLHAELDFQVIPQFPERDEPRPGSLRIRAGRRNAHQAHDLQAIQLEKALHFRRSDVGFKAALGLLAADVHLQKNLRKQSQFRGRPHWRRMPAAANRSHESHRNVARILRTLLRWTLPMKCQCKEPGKHAILARPPEACFRRNQSDPHQHASRTASAGKVLETAISSTRSRIAPGPRAGRRDPRPESPLDSPQRPTSPGFRSATSDQAGQPGVFGKIHEIPAGPRATHVSPDPSPVGHFGVSSRSSVSSLARRM